MRTKGNEVYESSNECELHFDNLSNVSHYRIAELDRSISTHPLFPYVCTSLSFGSCESLPRYDSSLELSVHSSWPLGSLPCFVSRAREAGKNGIVQVLMSSSEIFFPPGVVNGVTGFGLEASAALSQRDRVAKVGLGLGLG